MCRDKGGLPLFGADYHAQALFHALLVDNDMPGGRALTARTSMSEKNEKNTNDARDIVRCRDESRILIWLVLEEDFR